MDDIQLLPCPFCGKTPATDNYEVRNVMFWNVGCLNDDCQVHVETADFESIEEAIQAWNTRISQD